ncbi:hypothetical protein LTR09_003344 [Extremus antarcticus]|uniref:Alcohol dehydrogenase-like N-terminal domain-containing protein n=1 Tax=Extremus antarcticus TaxID=702011 RepID=A0AAJ0DRN8_9PEZI|nr:hypothetical protein LTR09_003344 [Extremus antarcticus]
MANRKRPEGMRDKPPVNQGDDISGVVHSVGEKVYVFKPGDRVMAFHEMMSPGGSYAEYALSWEHTTFPLPPNCSFEEGAAIPLAAMTAACALYAKLRLPPPFLPTSTPMPLIIYGASSAVGYYALQFALKSNIHPLICVAGRAAAHIEPLLDQSKGDTIVDYRQENDKVVAGLREALGDKKLEYAFDAVSEKGSYQNIAQVLDHQTGRITFVLPGKKYDDIPDSIEKTITRVGDVHGKPDDLREFGYVYFRYIGKGMAVGWFKAQPQEIVEGGLEGVQKGLEGLKEGRASAVKYIFRVGDTPGAGS